MKNPDGLFRKYFITGLFALLPLWLTFYILWLVFNFVGRFFSPSIRLFLRFFYSAGHVPDLLITLSSVMIMMTLIWGTGVLAGRLIGPRLIHVLDGWIGQIPLARSIYQTLRQVTDIFLLQRSEFKRVVVLEFPRRGVYAIGFVTNEVPWMLQNGEGSRAFSVFLPTTPNPTTGYYAIVPEKELRYLEMTVDEAVKLIISAGIIGPEGGMSLPSLPAETGR